MQSSLTTWKPNHSSRSSLLIRIAVTAVICALATSASAAHKMIVHKVTYAAADGLVIANSLPNTGGWYIYADQQSLLLQPVIFLLGEDSSAGSSSITLKNASGKTVAVVEEKGLLGAPYLSTLTRSAVGLFIRAGTSDVYEQTVDVQGFRGQNVTISPGTFGKGSQIILKFAGIVSEATTTFGMSADRMGDGAQVFNVPDGTLGRIVRDQPGSLGGHTQITIDFELIEE